MPISPDKAVKEYAKFLKDKHLASGSKIVTANKINNTTYRLGFTKSSCYVPEEIDEEFVEMMKKKYNITDRYTIYHGPSGVEFHYENINESVKLSGNFKKDVADIIEAIDSLIVPTEEGSYKYVLSELNKIKKAVDNWIEDIRY